MPVWENGAMTSFAVVDVETTGLDRSADRIVEIAVILLNHNLVEEGRWQSLVNPGRASAAVEIHGLSDAVLAGAPRFAEISQHVVDLLTGRVLVAHHAAFERAFLTRELMRAGYAGGPDEDACVCTMDQSRIYLPPGPHSLRGVAERLGLSPATRHRAMSDAETCARLLRCYVELEERGQRYTDAATNREALPVYPAQWRRARGWEPPYSKYSKRPAPGA